jgi:hypothetical protein
MAPKLIAILAASGVLLVGMGLVVMVIAQPLSPGQPGFGVQSALTDFAISLSLSSARRAARLVWLTQQRMEDYVALDGSEREYDALLALDHALQRAIIAAGELAYENRMRLLPDLELAARVLVNLLGDYSNPDPEVVVMEDAVWQRAQAFLDRLNAYQQPDNVLVALIDPQTVPFPLGSLQGHPFPLDGAHASVPCEGCHTGESYTDLSVTGCVDCHANPHDDGRGIACENCHDTSDWARAMMDHTGLTDCVSCHVMDSPPEHYAGQCSNCHVTTGWSAVTMDHTGLSECAACHSMDAPDAHYPGQCSACHSTITWEGAVFDHTGFTDCAACHTSDAPVGHYPGQCSACHSTATWLDAVFNHAGFTDCIGCHIFNAPAGHYPGQCSACHSTAGWAGAVFNHTGFTDCAACHASRAPAGHYPGQCSQCHGTASWLGAVFNHTGFTDCQACHARPSGHFAGQCSDCHTTATWGGATFNHTFPINHHRASSCAQCHPNSASGDWTWTCYICHDQTKIENKHREKVGGDFSNCIVCHWDGRKHDD